MDVNEDGNVENASSPVVLPSEMDYSLLASDMQKFLHISSTVSSESTSGVGTKVNGFNTNRRCKTRGGAYLEDYEINKCPLCSVSYHAKDTLAKHALRIHLKAVVALLQDVSTQQHLKCPFCVHKVMLRHQKLLLLHLEKKHAIEFLSFLRQSSVSKSIPLGNEITQSHLSAVNLHERMEGMSLSHFEKAVTAGTMPCLLKQDPTPTDSASNEEQFFLGSKFPLSNLKPCNLFLNQPYAKRKLILDGSDSRAVRMSHMKENLPPKESLSTTLSKGRWIWKHAQGKPFACGRCKEAFSCNAFLLDHVSGKHRGPLRLLQPVFTCGFCSASFYKNSFLVRHCFQHHTPMWIKK
ncbi:Transcription factor Ken 2 [Frankliniella fusca]|uniref:Transcription factor Ken 2 n=1 Tax=Frankliniella fusca TaxID=407009 RepID=A0AAE1GQS0_9NEOP|nr:Transcription factor Ken 2 [Frankliniella fusca]